MEINLRSRLRSFEHIDVILLTLTLIISSLGILTIYSVTFDDPSPQDYKKQVLWVAIGICLALMTVMVDYSIWKKIAPILYVITTLLLIYLLAFGKKELGVQRWIPIPVLDIRIQPSEFAKLTLILVLSRWLTRWRGMEPKMKDLVFPAALTGIPFILILSQPDLGTSLLIVPIFLALIFVSGFSLKKMAILGLIALFLVIVVGPHVIKPYQWQRIVSFLNPEADPLGAGYHLIQSEIAFGSGGFWGKGFRMGSQSHLDFLPVQDTDFIFSVWGEERGFLGSVLLLLLFSFLIYRSLRAARLSNDLFGTYLCIGLTVMLFCQIFINTGMVIGLMPITGLPLPFMSYGGSSCLTNFFAIALIFNVGMRRFSAYSK